MNLRLDLWERQNSEPQNAARDSAQGAAQAIARPGNSRSEPGISGLRLLKNEVLKRRNAHQRRLRSAPSFLSAQYH